jgi:hypothetical protein
MSYEDQYQAQSLAFAEPEQTMAFATLIGFKKIYSNPLHFFLKATDLQNPSKKKIKYYAYTVNLQKEIFWGYFDRASESFSIKTRCLYNSKDYAKFYYEWKGAGYELVDTYMEDKFTRRIARYAGNFPTEDEYIFYKTYLAISDGRTTNEQAQRTLGYDVLQRFSNWVELKVVNDGVSQKNAVHQIMKIIDKQIALYESLSNIRQTVLTEGKYISDLFYHYLETFPDIVTNLPTCPPFLQCLQDPHSDQNCGAYFPDLDNEDEESLR